MKLVIMDGNSIANRAFYGVHALNAPDGTPTNAVFGFLNIFNRIREQYRPDAICVAFDTHAKTFRHLADENYKATRKGMPEDLQVQMPILKELLDRMGIKHYEMEGYEADDILGTAAAMCNEKGWECVIVSGDKDTLQLVSKNTTVCNIKTRMGQTEYVNYTPEVFSGEYGFEPAGMVDLKALMGDSSDNIPGVPGVGEKTAKDLIVKYGSLNAIYSDEVLSEQKEALKKKLVNGRDSAFKSYWLATILCSVPVSFTLEDNLWQGSFGPGTYGLMKRLGFNKFIESWKLSPDETAPAEEAVPEEAAPCVEITDDTAFSAFETALSGAEKVSVILSAEDESLEVFDGRCVYLASWNKSGELYNECLKAVFNGNIKKLSHNVKDTMVLLLNEGLSTAGFVFDTAIAAYMLDSVAERYELEALKIKYNAAGSYNSEICFRLAEILNAKLSEYGMTGLYEKADFALCEPVAVMEHKGVLVDRKALYDFGTELDKGIALLQASIISHAGHEFNINSTKQLGVVLFEELMLPAGKKTKSGWSTSVDVLEKLKYKHPIVEEILEYRTLTKLKSTYTDGLLKVIAEDGRIHSKFQLTVTATGRLSSTEPNLQNIPIRKAVGAQIRKMFTAAPGCVLVDADYSQIELRLLSCIADDENMKEAFLSGEDFHTATASKVFGIPVSEVSHEMRGRAKAVNFGIIYGISAFSLSQDIGVSVAEAKQFIERYLERFPGVRKYMTEVIANADRDGYASTIYGRRRALPELKNSNKNIRSFGERIALNMPIQGAAADIIKMAMAEVYRKLKESGLDAALILQVHDELIIECRSEDAECVCEFLKTTMENVVSLAVPLSVEVKSGKTWAEAH